MFGVMIKGEQLRTQHLNTLSICLRKQILFSFDLIVDLIHI